MKVGDLVKLSAYGKKRQWNTPIVRENSDMVGLIIGYRPNTVYGYKVQWPIHVRGMIPQHSRREIKYAY